ncbi:SAM-dependent methyltransferase [Candidatus Pelagibacter ubique]|jgi:type I restriction enzyme M protein|nr:SAM-dependent methyltransferase [Candidatus Pelagibacter ubique]
MSERLTEKIVRGFLKDNGYSTNPYITVEEQTSKFKNIQRLLSKASKTKKGNKGFPEFIITNLSFPEHIIIIECKADIKKHSSKDLNDPQNYNVDGALHYSSYISKEFNVISFAISGVKKTNLKISSFIQKKNKKPINLKNSHQKDIEKFLRFDELVNLAGYDKDEAEVKVLEILKFSRNLHEFLRDHAKLAEAQKPLVICGTLIALMDQKFRDSFNSTSIKQVPIAWFDAIKREINKAKIPHLKKENILNSFINLKDHPPLNRPSNKFSTGIFYELIRSIKDEIFPYIYILNDYDIIGKFFNEFLKYSGGDKQSFGIVLTPKHITEFCVELANLNLDSIVVDTCCGTGGFLVAAMDDMLKKAITENDKKKIISKNLVGSEDLPEMFTLAAGNMILRGDGKANLYQGDCFSEDIKKLLREHRPNVGLINPPFSQKEIEVSELAYVINMLEVLEKKGLGIAVLPMNCVTNPSAAKHEILKNHTLLAVMSLPNKLFYPVGTVTCVVVIKAHEPHPKDFKTWFAFCKKDGFFNMHHRGRNDFNNLWTEIKKNWLNAFKNREIIKDFSLIKEVNANDEWCIEPYMVTDYSKINEKSFEAMVKEYLKFKLND